MGGTGTRVVPHGDGGVRHHRLDRDRERTRRDRLRSQRDPHPRPLGTLGWITLTVVATATWLFGGIDRRLAIALAVLVPVYVAAFYTGNFPARAVAGTLLLVAVVWLVVWAWQSYQAGERSLSRLAVVVGLTVFGIGSLLGVLLQISFAVGTMLLPGDGIGAHASTMVFGYVVVTAMGIIEFVLRGTRDLPRAGLAQIGLLVAGAIILMLGLLAGATQAAGGIYLLTALIGVVLFGVRLLPVALRVRWATPGLRRAAGSRPVDRPRAHPVHGRRRPVHRRTGCREQGQPRRPHGVGPRRVHRCDHEPDVRARVRFASARRQRWAAAEQVVFWAMNGGLAVFVVGLVANSVELKRIGAPIMGLAILLGLAVLAARLWRLEPDEATTPAVATAA